MGMTVISASTEPFKTILNLNEIDSFKLKVQILTPKIELEKVRFVIPSNVPGCISELQTGKLFSDIKAFDIEGKELGVKRNSLNDFEIYPATRLAKIEYWVHDSWHYTDPALILRQLGTSFIKDKHFLLNFHAIIGYIEGYESNPQQLEITKPTALISNSSLNLRTKGTTDTAEAINYLALLDNPILYSKTREVGYIVGKTHYHIGFYSENDSVKLGDVSKIVKAVSEDVDDFCEGLSPKDYYFLINYINPTANKIRNEEEYGAVEHSQSSVYCFPESSNKYRVQRDIQYTTAHELFHLFEPLNIKTDVTNKLNLRAKVQTGNLWLYEGFTEYFSLLMQYQKGLITEQDYITELRNKITLSQFYEPYSLSEQSDRCYLEGNEKGYQNFYYKGAIVAMMLDLKLMKLSKGEMSLKSLMTDIKNNARTNYVLKDEAVIPEMVKYSYPEVQDFFDSYVKGVKAIDYNEFLGAVGWKYDVQRLDTAKLFVNATYRYTKSSKEFYVTNIALDQIGMREGDVLFAIGGKEVTKENLQTLLEKFSDVNYNKDVVFTVKRNNELVELTGTPLTITKNQKNLIVVEKKVDLKKKAFRKRYSSSGLHKNRNFK